jgi:hypothetical protein
LRLWKRNQRTGDIRAFDCEDVGAVAPVRDAVIERTEYLLCAPDRIGPDARKRIRNAEDRELHLRPPARVAATRSGQGRSIPRH